MQPLVALLLTAMAMNAAEIKIDHVTIAGQSLDALRKTFTAATGIPTEYGGPHANHATEMALASFPDGSYLELMGIQRQADPKAVAAHSWGHALRENGGPCAFAVRVADVNAEVERLKKTGVHVGEAEKSGRTRPDGVALKWETADVGAGTRGAFFPFLIRDFTARDLRVFPSGKPTTTQVRGLAWVVIGVHDLEAAAAQYRKAFDLPSPRHQQDDAFGADLAWFEGTPVVLAMPRASGPWLKHRLEQFGDGPCAFVFADGEGAAPRSSVNWFGVPLEWKGDPHQAWRLGIARLLAKK